MYFFTGCFIKRQKIPLPGGDQDTGPYYKIRDLIIGESVIFYGKKIMITGANEYTRDFLQKMGLVINDNGEIPPNPYFEYRKKVKFYFFIIIIFFNKIKMRLDFKNITVKTI